MALKPWYTVVTPREDLREGKPLDASEFAVHLDHVRQGTAPRDYTDPERFFQRTYLTQALLDMAAQAVRRFSGITHETSPVFNLTTQFGGGKTHSLTLLYHLAQLGDNARDLCGVDRIIEKAGINEIKTARTAVFVGTEFSSVTGRGGNNEPLRNTPWGEMAYQLGGAAAFEKFKDLDKNFIPPSGDDLKQLFDENQPYLLLFDELLNYVSRHRHYYDLGGQFYNFLHTLTEFARSRSNIVMAVSIPASELEMSAEDLSDYERLKKMLDRLGKAIMMSADKETSEIIRRRLFEWNGIPDEAKATIKAYVDWVSKHRSHISFTAETAQKLFEASYPFHPAVLSLFERKWQTLPRFQQTRGILRLLALWVSHAYQDGFKNNTRDALITLGTAPLEDPYFRSAVFEQLGENRLEAAVTSDIAGKDDAHAIRLDKEASEYVKKARLHKKCATIIFFESNGGQTAQVHATLPEIKFSIGDPGLDIGLVDGVIQSLLDNCYYLTAVNNKFKYSIHENLIKRFTDRKASILPSSINELMEAEIRKVFDKSQGFEKVIFPERNNQVSDRPVLTWVVLHPSHRMNEQNTKIWIDDLVNNYGNSARIYKSSLIFCVAENDQPIKEEAKKFLAWDSILNEAKELNLNEEQIRQVKQNIERAKKDLVESIWRSYKNLVLLDKNNQLQIKDLGLIHSSQASSITEFYKTKLVLDGELTQEISPNLLVRNWPPAFKAWSTKNVRDAFYQSPQFPRLLNPEAIKNAISKGVANEVLAYVGLRNNKYDPFYFKTMLPASDVEISDDMYIITADEARKHQEPRRVKQVQISPQSIVIEPNTQCKFTVKAIDQFNEPIEPVHIVWNTTHGVITDDGEFTCNETEGIYQISATVDGIVAEATVRVARKIPTDSKTNQEPVYEPIPDSSLKISWSGQVDVKKWILFYSRILAKFANNPSLKLMIKFEAEETDPRVLVQKKEEIVTALRELGLDETNIE